MQSNTQPKPKSWVRRHKILTGFLAILGIFIFLLIIGASADSPQEKVADSQEVTDIPEASTEPVVADVI